MTNIIWDKKDMYVYLQTTKELYAIIDKRFGDFLAVVSDVNTEPVKVFDDLKAKQIEELELIREVSRELQRKKVEDINKQKAAEVEEKEEEAESKKETVNSEEQKETPVQAEQN